MTARKTLPTLPVTDWFPFDVKPVRKGVYNASVYRDPESYRYWNGREWGVSCRTPEGSLQNSHLSVGYHYIEWRGLAQEPK